MMHLLLLLTLLTGVCPMRPLKIYVKEGEMAALYCGESSQGNVRTMWKRCDTEQEVYSNMTAPEQRQKGVVVLGNSLVILSASVNQQGNYSCSLEDSSNKVWFTVTVCTAQSGACEGKFLYPLSCYTHEACELSCPEVNIPPENITSKAIIWHKANTADCGEGGPSSECYFSSVEEENAGVYSCVRSYLYYDRIYNMSFTVELSVQPNKNPQKFILITSPRNNSEVPVELGSSVVVPCEAVTYSCSDFNSLFWLAGDSFVETDSALRVFYNSSCNNSTEKLTMTASLVIKNLTKEDLSKQYICKLESDTQYSNFVTVNLTLKVGPSYIPLTVCIISIVTVTLMTVVMYVKFKVDIALFFRDALGCRSSTPDGKSYDAFLMCYESNAGAGMNANDRRCLESTLEDRFGYSLCLFDRDVLPGKDVAEAVLDCVELSRAVVLVPTSPDPVGPGSGLLSAIHEALVERQTRLVFISTDTTQSPSLPEALQLFCEAGHHVTWRGSSCMQPSSSSFWKQLRYYLPAPQHTPKVQLLPQTVQEATS